VPIAVAIIENLDRQANPERYQSLTHPLILSVLMGGIGAILACVVFFIVAVNIPGIFGGINSVEMNYALREQIWSQPVITVLVASILASSGIGIWLNMSLKQQ